MSFVATPGVVVDGAYRLEFPLGEGGFGAVWRAVELASDRRVGRPTVRP